MTKIEELTNEQLDVLVAEKVLEWTLIRCTSGGNTVVGFDEEARRSRLVCPPEDWSGQSVFRPSTDIACAFQVVEKMRMNGYRFVLWNTLDTTTAQFSETPPGRPWGWGAIYGNESLTASRAISIAALKACGIEEV